MPWYEPAIRAPPTPIRNGNGHSEQDDEQGNNNNNGGGGRNYHRYQHEDSVDVQSYLDPNWNYGASSSAGNQHGLNFDGFQHQVESQLASVFPFADFSSSHHDPVQNNFISRQSSSSLYHNESHASFPFYGNAAEGGSNNGDQRGQKQNEDPNPKTEGGNVKPESKAAQFFHPRPVMALMPYRDFFSPMSFPAEGGGTDAAGKPPPPINNDMGGIWSTQHSQQEQLRNTHHSHQEQALGNTHHSQQEQLRNTQHSHQEQLLGSTRHSQQEQLRNTQHSQQEQLRNIHHSEQEQPRNSHHPQQEQLRNTHHLQQETFHTQAPHQDSQRQQQTPAKQSCNLSEILEPNKESSSEPTSNLKGKRLSNVFEDFVAKPRKDPFKQPPKQAKLVQDSNTGKMGSSVEVSKPGEKQKAKSWDSYGGRPVDGDGKNDKTTAKKKDKKKKSKDKKQSKQSEGGMGAFLNKGKKRPSNDSQEDDGATNVKRKSKKQERRDRSLAEPDTELEIPCYDVEDFPNPDIDGAPKLSEEHFNGIEQMGLQNAAACLGSLKQFLAQVRRQKHVSFTMLFLDPYTGNYTTSASGKKKKRTKAARSNKYTQQNASHGYECTTPFLPTSKKYCTPKGYQCTAWNCTCEEQIRATRGSAMLLGAMFVFLNRHDDGGDDGAGEGSEWLYYLLPLGPTDSSEAQQEVEYPRMNDWPVNPMHCDVSLSDRWSAFEGLLLNESTKLVTYNATVSLLPFYHHQANETRSGQTSNQFASELPIGRDNGYLGSIWDLRLASWILRPHASDSELEWLSFKEGFGHMAPGHQQAPNSDMPALMQGLTDAKNNLELVHVVYPIMNQRLIQGGMLDALQCIEAPMQSILASMESRGIGFNPARLKNTEEMVSARIEELETQSRSITKHADFLLSSPQQVSGFLFDVLKLSIPAGLISKTKSGSSHRSTSEDALKAIKADMTSRTGSSPQIIDIILEFRGLNKLLTSFIRPLPKICKRVNKDGKKSRSKKNKSFRIYPQWMQTSARTGRLSCRKPNLQQIPKGEAAHGVVPRDAFIAEEGMCLFACDYSQKEVRILAHMSDDRALISLFRGDPKVDIYKQMSSLIRNKPIESITATDRAQFKQVTLAILYGMGVGQVAKNLNISKNNAQKMMNDFFRRFQRLKAWMDETIANAKRNLYVKTITGRKRYLDDINSDDSAKRSRAERQAINTVIQGSAADLMKTAMIYMATNLMRWEDETRPRMLLQIHDEAILEFQLNETDSKRLQSIAIKSCCTDCEKFYRLKVPLLLTSSAGLTWGAMNELDDI